MIVTIVQDGVRYLIAMSTVLSLAELQRRPQQSERTRQHEALEDEVRVGVTTPKWHAYEHNDPQTNMHCIK